MADITTNSVTAGVQNSLGNIDPINNTLKNMPNPAAGLSPNSLQNLGKAQNISGAASGAKSQAAGAAANVKSQANAAKDAANGKVADAKAKAAGAANAAKDAAKGAANAAKDAVNGKIAEAKGKIADAKGKAADALTKVKGLFKKNKKQVQPPPEFKPKELPKAPMFKESALPNKPAPVEEPKPAEVKPPSDPKGTLVTEYKGYKIYEKRVGPFRTLTTYKGESIIHVGDRNGATTQNVLVDIEKEYIDSISEQARYDNQSQAEKEGLTAEQYFAKYPDRKTGLEKP